MFTNTFFVDTWWVCWRELKHLLGQKMRLFMTLFQPFIWLTLMGNLFERVAMIPGFPAAKYLDYMTPGIVVMVTLFAGMFGGMSIVWDRRLGFFQKMLAAPISRAAVVAGKMLAIGIQTAFQSLVILGIAWGMGVSFAAGPLGILPLAGLAFLLSMAFAGLSLSLGAVLTSHEALIAVVNFLTMPLVFTSNAMMPLDLMPDWLAGLATWNPLSYAINPMRGLFLTGWAWNELLNGALVLALVALVTGSVATALIRRSLA